MKRRTLILGGMAAMSAPLFATGLASAARAKATFSWKGSEFKAGGTAGIDLAALPKPLFRDAPNCEAIAAATLGPCDSDTRLERADISEGLNGLPMRMALKIVEATTCAPIPGAVVDVWHTTARGFYSGADVAGMCTLDDDEAVSGFACRGRQTSQDDGVAQFLTVYPGWYSGRALHVHLRVMVDDSELLISQIYFDDALTDAIFSDHPDYAAREARDTRNDDDRIFPGGEDVIFDFEKLDSGVLSASLVIGVVR